MPPKQRYNPIPQQYADPPTSLEYFESLIKQCTRIHRDKESQKSCTYYHGDNERNDWILQLKKRHDEYYNGQKVRPLPDLEQLNDPDFVFQKCAHRWISILLWDWVVPLLWWHSDFL